MALWSTNVPRVEHWNATIRTGTNQWIFDQIQPMWQPAEAAWAQIKQAAGANEIRLTIWGTVGPNRHVRCSQTVSFTLAGEAVSAPVFYREVNLPFREAVKDPSRIRWRFGSLTQRGPPPVVLEHLPVCGNCHSFTRKGERLAMDVDYANSKASYIITKTAPEMSLATSDIITWNDFKPEDRQQTFGLLSQISPDGRYVLSTVKDRSVFVPRPELAFSQLFFPLKGILCVYDCEAKTFSALPGADDPAFVQSNPVWSPDGQWIVFARNRAAELENVKDTGRILLTTEECEDFLKHGRSFKFDLYRLPFNSGKGGTPEPLRGASRNGRSNYFPKFSPDGKWIVFCQASNYMLLQPDSALYIVPAAGGEARRLECNLTRMNSWHSWSPDGKWLIFSSKEHSDYTQLYLARITDAGRACPPVWLAHLVQPGWAANIPEFVDLPPEAIVKIREQFLDDYSYVRAGNEFLLAGEADKALEKYRLALSLNPENAMAHQRIGFLLYRAKHQMAQAIPHMETALKLQPHNGFAHFDLGSALADAGDLTNAVVHLAEAVRLIPSGFDRHYDAVEINLSLAMAHYQLEHYTEAIPALETALRINRAHARANYLMAMTQAWLGQTDATLPYYQAAIQADPKLARLPDYYDLLSRNYVALNQFAEGFAASEKGSELALRANRREQAARLRQRLEYCASRR